MMHCLLVGRLGRSRTALEMAPTLRGGGGQLGKKEHGADLQTGTLLPDKICSQPGQQEKHQTRRTGPSEPRAYKSRASGGETRLQAVGPFTAWRHCQKRAQREIPEWGRAVPKQTRVGSGPVWLHSLKRRRPPGLTSMAVSSSLSLPAWGGGRRPSDVGELSICAACRLTPALARCSRQPARTHRTRQSVPLLDQARRVGLANGERDDVAV